VLAFGSELDHGTVAEVANLDAPGNFAPLCDEPGQARAPRGVENRADGIFRFDTIGHQRILEELFAHEKDIGVGST
jgi:hypothetical protein